MKNGFYCVYLAILNHKLMYKNILDLKQMYKLNEVIVQILFDVKL